MNFEYVGVKTTEFMVTASGSAQDAVTCNLQPIKSEVRGKVEK